MKIILSDRNRILLRLPDKGDYTPRSAQDSLSYTRHASMTFMMPPLILRSVLLWMINIYGPPALDSLCLGGGGEEMYSFFISGLPQQDQYQVHVDSAPNLSSFLAPTSPKSPRHYACPAP